MKVTCLRFYAKGEHVDELLQGVCSGTGMKELSQPQYIGFCHTAEKKSNHS